MKKTEKLQQEEIEKLKKDDFELYELEQLITEGAEAKIPFEFIYPNTDKKVGVLLKPLPTDEYMKCINRGKKENRTYLIEILKVGLFTLDEEPFPPKLLNKLPAGVVSALVNEINRISGVEIAQEYSDEFMEQLMGF